MSKTILTVDDSQSVRLQLRLLLENSGYVVIEASNGADGIQEALSHSIDLMLVDINMPIMDGITMVREIRKLPQYASTPILVLTTELGRSAVQQGKSVGVTAWIVKPFKPDLLLQGIQRMLDVPPESLTGSLAGNGS